MVVEWNQQQQAAQRLVFMVRPVGEGTASSDDGQE
jgi:hypothetical protein